MTKRALVAIALALAAVGCGGGSSSQQPPIGRGRSLQPLPLYRVADSAHGSRAVREAALVPGQPARSIRIERHPAAELHVTAAEAAAATRFGWRLEVYAAEVSRLFPTSIAHRPYVVVFQGVAYRVVPVSGDAGGLNLSVLLGTTDRGFAVSLAGALTSEVRVQPASAH